jgi:hypothetical protein
MERAFSICLSSDWDDACRRRDRGAMIALLNRIEMLNAPKIVDQILANPEIYLAHLRQPPA